MFQLCGKDFSNWGGTKAVTCALNIVGLPQMRRGLKRSLKKWSALELTSSLETARLSLLPCSAKLEPYR